MHEPMDSLARRYQEELKTREDVEWDEEVAAAKARLVQPETETSTPAPAPTENEPASWLNAGGKPAIGKAVATGAKTAGQTHVQGYQLAREGFLGLISPPEAPEMPGSRFGREMGRARAGGQFVAGLFQMTLGAAFGGGMAAIDDFAKSVTPETMKARIEGTGGPGGVAPLVRMLMGQAQPGIDKPEERAAFFSELTGAEAVQAMVMAAMTEVPRLPNGASIFKPYSQPGAPGVPPMAAPPKPTAQKALSAGEPQKALGPAKSAEVNAAGPKSEGPQVPASGEPRPMGGETTPVAIMGGSDAPVMTWSQSADGALVLEMEPVVTPQGGKVFQAAAAGVADELAMDLESLGGFSFSQNYGKVQAPKGSRVVSIAPELELTIQGKATAADISKYMADNAEVLSDPRAAFGAWYDAATDKTYLDISISVAADQANDIGRSTGQRAVYDPETQTSLPVDYGDAGHAPVDPLKLPPIAERLAQGMDLAPEVKPVAKPGEGATAQKFRPSAQEVGVGQDWRKNYQQLLVNEELLAELRQSLMARARQILDRAKDETGAIVPGAEIGTREFRALMKDAITYGAVELHRGAKKFAEWSEAMVAGTGEFIRPHLKKIYEESQALVSKFVKSGKGHLATATKIEEFQKKGEHNRVWYHGFMPEARAYYGDQQAQLFKKFVAVTSQMNDVDINIDFAIEAFAAHQSGQGFGHLKFGLATGQIQANLRRAVKWFDEGADPNVQPLRGIKVTEFDVALGDEPGVTLRGRVRPEDAFVADRWMHRFFFGKDGATQPQWDFMRAFMEREAQLRGISTRDFQAMLWTSFKAAAEANEIPRPWTGTERPTKVSGTLDPIKDVLHRKLNAEIVEDGPIPVDDIVEVIKDLPMGEEGRISVGTSLLLTRVALGAIAGAATGDSPEERFRNMLLMGFGAAVAPAVVRGIFRGTTIPGMPGPVPNVSTATKKAMLSQTPYQPNYNYIKADADVKAAMKASYKLAHDRIAAGRKGVQTHDKTQAQADQFIASGELTVEKVMEMTPSTDPQPVHVVKAMRDLEVGVAEYAAKVKDRVLAGNAAPGELRQAIALSVAMAERVSLAKTGYGRALDSLKIMAEAETGRISPETVARFADGIDPRMSEMELARALDVAEKVAGKPGKKGFLGMVGSFPEVFMELFYGSILWSKAIGRNLIGNLTLEMAAEPVQALASLMPRGIPFVTKAEGWLKPGITLSEAGAQLHGRIEGFRKGAIARAQLAKFDEAGGGKYDLIAENKAAIAVADPTNAVGVALNYLGSTLRGASTILGKQDIFSKFHHISARIHGMAHRKALTEGLTGEAFQRRYMDLVDDPTLFSQSERSEIARMVKQDTYTMEIENPLAKGVMDTIARFESGNAAFRFLVLAFPRITGNMFETFASYTPGLNLASTRWWRAMRAGGAEAQRAHAQLALGTAILGTLMYYADEGLIQGDHAEDTSKKRSFRLPGTDHWVSYKGLGFLEDIVAFSADSRAAIARLPQKDLPKVALAMVLSMYDAFDNMAFIQTFGEFASILTPTLRSEARVEKLEEYGQKKLLSLVPFSGALRELRRTTDSTRREAKEFTQRLYDNLPGFSMKKDKHGNWEVPPRRDLIYGDEEKVTNIPFLTTATADKSDDPVWGEIYRLTKAMSTKIVKPIPDHAVPGLTENDLQLSPTPMGKHGFALTHQEKDRLAVIMTKELRLGGNRLMHQNMKDLIESDRYQNRASDQWRAEQLSDIYNQYLKGATEELLQQSPALRREVLRVKGENEINSLPPDRQPAAREALRNRIKVTP